jgi:hypothetical protein
MYKHARSMRGVNFTGESRTAAGRTSAPRRQKAIKAIGANALIRAFVAYKKKEKEIEEAAARKRKMKLEKRALMKLHVGPPHTEFIKQMSVFVSEISVLSG